MSQHQHRIKLTPCAGLGATQAPWGSHSQRTGTFRGTQPTLKAVVADVCGSSAKMDAVSSLSVEGFYDGLAGAYHLIFGDW